MTTREKYKQLISSFSFLSTNYLGKRLLLTVGLFVIILSILYLSVLPDSVSLELGRPSPTTIFAPREAVDYYATKQLRDEAAEAVPETFEFEPGVLTNIIEELSIFMGDIYDIRKMEVEDTEKINQLMDYFPFELNKAAAELFINEKRDVLEGLEKEIGQIIQNVMEQGVKDAGIDNAGRQIAQEINLLPYEKELKDALSEVVKALIRPNLVYNEKVTVRSMEQAIQNVEPVKILKGARIISEGETVTEKHIAQIEALGLQRTFTDYSILFGLAFLLLVLFIIGGYYLYFYEKEIFYSPSLLLLLGFILVITLIFTVGANYFSGYLIPVAMGVILITVLFDSRLAILCNIILAVLAGVITGGEFRFIVVALLGGLAAVYSVSRLYQRSDLTKAGFFVALANTFTIIAIFLFLTGFCLDYEIIKEFSISIVSGIGNGLFSAVMAIGLLPYLENGFGLTTPVSLLELANPNHTLLRQLLMKAPGTYHHSIIVANLAEAAAEVVGADSLLSRVGAYYHDIGKTKRPYFFIENQLGNENPHNKISASLSTLIIINHVKDGLEMARQEKLPSVILDIIQQHHGTSLISYFYHQAVEKEKNEEVIEDSYRYEGPKPQTKEAAIIMLADSVEAAVRAMSKPAGGRLEGLIRKIIKDKLNDGQLDESDLTFKDLDKVAEVFTKVLSGIFHSRIEYPEKELKAEMERRKQQKNGISHKQPSGKDITS